MRRLSRLLAPRDPAASDVLYLSDAIIAHYRRKDESALLGYRDRALARIWKSERFGWSLTKLMHSFPDQNALERQMQVAEMDYLSRSPAMQTAIAKN